MRALGQDLHGCSPFVLGSHRLARGKGCDICCIPDGVGSLVRILWLCANCVSCASARERDLRACARVRECAILSLLQDFQHFAEAFQILLMFLLP